MEEELNNYVRLYNIVVIGYVLFFLFLSLLEYEPFYEFTTKSPLIFILLYIPIIVIMSIILKIILNSIFRIIID